MGDGRVLIPRVLFVCPSMHPRNGGPPRVVNGSAIALAKQGIPVEIATTEPADSVAATHEAWPGLVEHGVKMHIFPRAGPQRLGRSPALSRMIADNIERFDLLHVHCVWEKALADAAALFRSARKPVFVSPHGMLDQWQMAQSTLVKQIALRLFGTGAMLKGADALLFGTQDEADEARPLNLPGPVVRMPNGVSPVDLGNPAAARAAILQRFPTLRAWKRIVLFFSRLHHKKGLDMLVEAFGRVHRDFPDAGIFAAAIAQDERYATAVRARIEELQPTNILLTTELEGSGALAAVAGSDIFCLPSHQEGFSIAIIEALAAGLPVLITDQCHMQELDPHRVGFAVPATIDGLEHGLRQILSLDADEIAAMSARAEMLVETHYTWDRVAERLSSAYRDALAKRPSGPR
jgi:glycosyltransferase involved in cell wall biosynthesis